MASSNSYRRVLPTAYSAVAGFYTGFVHRKPYNSLCEPRHRNPEVYPNLPYTRRYQTSGSFGVRLTGVIRYISLGQMAHSTLKISFIIKGHLPLVPVRGLEPLWYYHGNLNPTCLPVPPHRHIKKCGWRLSGGTSFKKQHSSH